MNVSIIANEILLEMDSIISKEDILKTGYKSTKEMILGGSKSTLRNFVMIFINRCGGNPDIALEIVKSWRCQQ